MSPINQLVIICGGTGSRLSGVIGETPKALLDINGKDLLTLNIERFFNQGVKKFHLLLGKYSEQIINRLPIISEITGANIAFTIEPKPLGSGGAIINAISKLDPFFMVMHGDLLIDFKVDFIQKAFDPIKFDFAQIYHPNSHNFDSDLIEIGLDGQIKQYHLKPRKSYLEVRNRANAGFYLFSKRLFDNLEFEEIPIDLDRQILPKLLSLGARGLGVQNSGFIRDLGTPIRLQKILEDTKKPYITSSKKPALFIDRDGTLNVEKGHIKDPELIELYSDVFDLIEFCNNSGVRVFVITNQPVIARGEANFEDIEKIHSRIDRILAEQNLYIDDYFYCPHHPESGHKGEVPSLKIICDCRKPNNGLIELAFRKFDIERRASFMVGDKNSDVLAGKKSNLKTIYIKREVVSPNDHGEGDFAVSNLHEAKQILQKIILNS